ncbi:alpha/beta fold hydrolase [Yinghuangia soli]|uniref:Alpha/beta fold hydrolase n=1 Tax=Yinghuangia soli TaxID=2908204 RepID=A0AA41U0V1_9ACTN|nr:alpha/beta hydrolase [Yinghuangia soli]MCF2528991.1 alpha/beta fold hydrolase [Yinghuangia soli]
MTGNTHAAPETTVRIGDVDLAVQAFGDPAAPAVLLIAGAESSMDWWHDELVDRIAGRGRYVIRYDARDTGRSTTYPVGAPGYTGDDLTADALGVLDAFGLRTAHIVGISMGGGIAQDIGIAHPDRAASLTLMSTTLAGPGSAESTELPPMSEDLAKLFAEPAEGPDWSDRDAVLAYFVTAERNFSGTIPVDEDEIRRIAGRAFDRSPSPAAAANHWIMDQGDKTPGRVGDITAPTLVMHGTADPLFPYGHGEALAAAIPGARLVALPGAGHQMPPRQVWDIVVDEIAAHTAAPTGTATPPAARA